MELQLGLALNSYGSFDINDNNYSSSSSSSGGGYSGGCSGKKRRCFDEENRIVPTTLPLLLWDTNQQPNDEDDPKDLDDNSSSAIFKNGEGLVGWPPVKARRKKLRRHVTNCRADHNGMAAAAENFCGRRGLNSTYVKVKMEGNGIARKIDISAHHSFESLTTKLMGMFCISDEKSFKLTYQDREGDWLLAEDVPWRTFIRSLKCIKLIRSRC